MKTYNFKLKINFNFNLINIMNRQSPFNAIADDHHHPHVFYLQFILHSFSIQLTSHKMMSMIRRESTEHIEREQLVN